MTKNEEHLNIFEMETREPFGYTSLPEGQSLLCAKDAQGGVDWWKNERAV